MRYHLTTLALGPLLLAQGAYVRRVTPRLPEPPGMRSGLSGSGPALKVLILGDSAAAGVGASSQQRALSGCLVEALRGHFQVHWRLLAQTGHKAREVLDQLEQLEAEAFDVVLTSIGVNDVTAGTSLRRWVSQQHELIRILKDKFQAEHILLSSLPPMQHFTALPAPLRGYLGLRARRLAEQLAQLAATEHRCVVIDVDFPCAAHFLASDGFHPGEPAYALWAERVAGVIRARLAQWSPGSSVSGSAPNAP